MRCNGDFCLIMLQSACSMSLLLHSILRRYYRTFDAPWGSSRSVLSPQLGWDCCFSGSSLNTFNLSRQHGGRLHQPSQLPSPGRAKSVTMPSPCGLVSPTVGPYPPSTDYISDDLRSARITPWLRPEPCNSPA